METESQRAKEWDGDVPGLDGAIGAMDLAGRTSGIAPAKVAFGSVSILLATIRVCFLSSATVCSFTPS
jgi:hypothetical protein